MPWQTNAGFLVAVAAVRVRTFWCRVAAVSELCPVAETRQLKRSVETRARPRVSFQRAVTDYSKAFFEHSKSRLAVLRYATPHSPTPQRKTGPRAERRTSRGNPNRTPRGTAPTRRKPSTTRGLEIEYTDDKSMHGTRVVDPPKANP